MRILQSLFFVFAAAADFRPTWAQELNIGHLEATDDSGINWQYYACKQSDKTLHCDIAQTFINREIEPESRDAQIQAKTTPAMIADGQKELAGACQNIGPLR